MSLYEVGEKAAELGAEKIIIVDRWKGDAGRIRFFKVEEGVTQVSPYIFIRGIKLQREFKASRKPNRLLFIEDADAENPEIKRLKEKLSDFLSLPIMDINEAPPEYRATMRLSMSPSRLLRISFYTLPENVEVGPRITISKVAWEI